ncbi:IS5 family transposase [Aurantimonas aggregata]|uniref:IS5 family transposase n=1 Tax=Aurantimonas aggregata TaxID=2047720 RepID=A0A6L9MPN8_9HYPH|nr:IS5 family transposase [Aurantimonas aggregata]
MGPSRGGQTTKIHAVTDLLGRPAVLRVTAGNVADVTMAGPLMDAAGRVRCLIADKGYDANALRRRMQAEGAEVVIPGRSNRKVPIDYDEARYKGRWRIEAAFCRLKDFRRIATRYDKLARNFLSAVALAILIAFWV